MYFVTRDREGVRTGADVFYGADTGNHSPRQEYHFCLTVQGNSNRGGAGALRLAPGVRGPAQPTALAAERVR